MKISEKVSEFLYAIGTIAICILMVLLILCGW